MPTLVGADQVLGTCAATPYAFKDEVAQIADGIAAAQLTGIQGQLHKAKSDQRACGRLAPRRRPSTGLKRAGARRLPTMASVGVECRAFTAVAGLRFRSNVDRLRCRVRL